MALLLIVVLAFMLVNNRSSAPGNLKLVVGLTEGGYPDFALAVRQAAQLAYDAAAPSLTRSIELVFVNNSDPQKPINEMYEAQVIRDKLLDDLGVLAYVGAYSSGQARNTILAANGGFLTVISPSASWPGLTKPGFAPGEPGMHYPSGQRNFFRVVPADDVQGVAAARWLSQQGLRRVYILHSTTTYGAGLAGIFEANAADHGLEVLGKQLYNIDDVSEAQIRLIVNSISQAQPDAVLAAMSWEGKSGAVLRAVRRALPDTPVLGGDAIMQDTLPDDHDALNGVYATNLVAPPERLPNAQAFVVAYRERYSEEPADYQLPVYEAVQVALRAIDQAQEPTRRGVLRYLRTMSSYKGILGTWHFDRSGDISLQTIAVARFEADPDDPRLGVWRSVTVVN
ncbi:MAG: branched-chain amino acid ABC transporter substrate-binding protein [Anaerolineae bacterium]|nr:branched-chain amino acid ABC transporter substrate-binding protein [Anaerolineae bacterium]MDW8173912.1 branched-chain amino acid ABC transporter substrate-binding protein [Anaerolineae bacterium]